LPSLVTARLLGLVSALLPVPAGWLPTAVNDVPARDRQSTALAYCGTLL
jgi:hypothetical protein